jgi:hypothetical protein
VVEILAVNLRLGRVTNERYSRLKKDRAGHIFAIAKAEFSAPRARILAYWPEKLLQQEMKKRQSLRVGVGGVGVSAKPFA